MPTNACVIYLSIKGWSDSKICKTEFSILKLKIARPTKYDSSGRAHQLMTKVTVSSISIQSLLLWLPGRTDQVTPPITVNIFVFVLLIVM